MPNPSFEPLTLSQEEWNDCTQYGCECRQLNITNCLACRMKAECEAQAQAAAFLRLQLRVITEQRDSLVVEQVSLRQRLEEAHQAGENLHAKWRETEAKLAQAQQRLRVATSQIDQLVPQLTQAQRERDKWLGAFNRSEHFQDGWIRRASQAEAALEEMRTMLDGFQEWLRHTSFSPHPARVAFAEALTELQRRRSAPGQEN